jgi:hypothetical protein
LRRRRAARGFRPACRCPSQVPCRGDSCRPRKDRTRFPGGVRKAVYVSCDRSARTRRRTDEDLATPMRARDPVAGLVDAPGRDRRPIE